MTNKNKNNLSPAESTASGAVFSSLGLTAPRGLYLYKEFSMKDPAVLFYSDNFLSGTMFFTDEQVGKYIRALCAQHLHGHLTEKQLNSIIKNDADIKSKFSIDENGLYYNNRMKLEVEKRHKYSEKQRDRINKRWNKYDTTVLPRNKSGNTIIEMESEFEFESNSNNLSNTGGMQGGEFYNLFKKAFPLNGTALNPEVLNWFILRTEENFPDFEKVIKAASEYATHWKELEPDTYPNCKMMKDAIKWLREAKYEIDWIAKLKAELRYIEKKKEDSIPEWKKGVL